MGEKILVFKKELFTSEIRPFSGVTTQLEDLTIFFRKIIPHSYFVDRAVAETDETIIQVIPYVIIKHRDTFATYTRGAKGGEARLHHKISIGLGGHINIDDLVSAMTDFFDLIEGTRSCQEAALVAAMQREIYEEIKWVGTSDIVRAKPQMLVYDDSEPVGRVHLGVVFIAQLRDTPTIRSSEEEIEDFGWKNINQLDELSNRLEGWSKLLLDYL